MMTTLLLCFALWQDPGAWKTRNLTIVVQHSGAHRAVGPVIVSLLQRIFAVRPSSVEVSLIGFERDFQQLEGQRYLRKAEVLQPRTTDTDALSEVAAGLVFNGPSPIYDAVIASLADKPDKILLISNGVDNASQASFDDLMAAAGKANVPITTLYFFAEPTSGGDTRLKKLAKATGGRFIDVRVKDTWEQLVGALR
jgi:hypothetical protein